MDTLEDAVALGDRGHETKRQGSVETVEWQGTTTIVERATPFPASKAKPTTTAIVLTMPPPNDNEAPF